MRPRVGQAYALPGVPRRIQRFTLQVKQAVYRKRNRCGVRQQYLQAVPGHKMIALLQRQRDDIDSAVEELTRFIDMVKKVDAGEKVG